MVGFAVWPLVEPVTGAWEFDAAPFGDFLAERGLCGTTTTGPPPGFGAAMNCEVALSECGADGATAVDPIATTPTVAAVVTPTSRPAATTVFVVVAASTLGRCSAASFT